MALNAAQQWWIRTGGNVLNGGGFDATISGAGTNYADQDAAQLSLSDFATSGAGSTTLTSATGGFTSQMVGNIIRIASGTNFQAGYYAVTGYTNTNTVTLDRTPTSGGAGSGGVGRLGGAFADLVANFATDPVATISSPLAAGHTINIRGSGSDNPSSADYTITSGYKGFVNGSASGGWITLKGYNGRPYIATAGTFYSASYWRYERLKFVFTAAPADGVSENVSSLVDCLFDQAGYDSVFFRFVYLALGNRFYNSGGTSASTKYAIGVTWGGQVIGNFFSDYRGGCINAGQNATIAHNIFDSWKGTSAYGVVCSANDQNVQGLISQNSFYGGASDGVNLSAVNAISGTAVIGNIFDSCGGYGLNCSTGTAATNDLRRMFHGYNAYYNNTSGARNGVSAGTSDVTLTGSPFTDAAGGDFNLNSTAGAGASCTAASFPSTFP